MIIVNSPHNPTGSLLTRPTGKSWPNWCRYRNRRAVRRGLRAHLVRRRNPRQPVRASELAARTVVSSFGKTYHITGWKIGYVVGPAALMAEFRKVHQFNVFSVHAPSQLALAEYMQDAARHLRWPPSIRKSATSLAR
jgi:methionine aminotransferase